MSYSQQAARGASGEQTQQPSPAAPQACAQEGTRASPGAQHQPEQPVPATWEAVHMPGVGWGGASGLLFCASDFPGEKGGPALTVLVPWHGRVNPHPPMQHCSILARGPDRSPSSACPQAPTCPILQPRGWGEG